MNNSQSWTYVPSVVTLAEVRKAIDELGPMGIQSLFIKYYAVSMAKTLKKLLKSAIINEYMITGRNLT